MTKKAAELTLVISVAITTIAQIFAKVKFGKAETAFDILVEGQNGNEMVLCSYVAERLAIDYGLPIDVVKGSFGTFMVDGDVLIRNFSVIRTQSRKEDIAFATARIEAWFANGMKELKRQAKRHGVHEFVSENFPKEVKF